MTYQSLVLPSTDTKKCKIFQHFTAYCSTANLKKMTFLESEILSENHEDKYNRQVPLQFWTIYSAVAHVIRAALIILQTADVSCIEKVLAKTATVSVILTKKTFKSCSFWHRESPIQALRASYLSPLCRHRRQKEISKLPFTTVASLMPNSILT